MSGANFLPEWLEHRRTHVRPAQAEFDATVAAGSDVEEAARKYLRVLTEYRRLIDDSPGGAESGGDGSAAMGALFTGADELYAEIDSEMRRVVGLAGGVVSHEG